MRTSILDGEVTWAAAGARYHVFDVLWLDGSSVTPLPLDERRALLARAAASAAARSGSTRIDDPEPWERACREGWEGVIAKRRDSPYEHRRSPHWLKMKCEVIARASSSAASPIRRARASGSARCSSATSTATTWSSPARSAPASTPQAAARPSRAARRARDPDAAVHEGRSGCRACARTGSGRRSSCRSAFIEWTGARQAAPPASARRAR